MPVADEDLERQPRGRDEHTQDREHGLSLRTVIARVPLRGHVPPPANNPGEIFDLLSGGPPVRHCSEELSVEAGGPPGALLKGGAGPRKQYRQ